MDRKIFSLDRFEGEMAVCVSDGDEVIVVPKESLGEIYVRDVFSARVEGGELCDIVPMPKERDKRLVLERMRLHAMARKRKNKF